MQRKAFLRILLLLPGLLAGGACTTSRPAPADVITVEGQVASRGAEPFAAYVLETEDRNHYVLTLTPEQLRGFSTPARLRVTGELYLDDWAGQPYAHLRVTSWTPVRR